MIIIIGNKMILLFSGALRKKGISIMLPHVALNNKGKLHLGKYGTNSLYFMIDMYVRNVFNMYNLQDLVAKLEIKQGTKYSRLALVTIYRINN